MDTLKEAFSLENQGAYEAWRSHKFETAPSDVSQLIVEVADPFQISIDEKQSLLQLLQNTNMAIYKLDPRFTQKEVISEIGRQFGLSRLDENLCADEDSITSLQVMPNGRQQGYIPYSNLRLSWHTDGYYNLPQEWIHAVILHCVRPAAEGGENLLLDHEMLYIYLRDQNPAYISALMQTDVMTIPPNIENGVEIRGAQTGPVFSISGEGKLHMRYTHRAKNIEWKQEPLVEEAVACLKEYLDNPEDHSEYIYKYKLQAGEGLLSNNVLHSRTGFKDDESAGPGRLLYRARYFDRIANT